MDRYWLLTWTTYGTWLPGDARGFVTLVRDDSGKQTIHNVPGTEYDANMPKLREYARKTLKGPPIYIVENHARVLLTQFQETAAYRSWQLLAAAIMANHVHLVVGVPGDPDPSVLLEDFKAYGSRALNRTWGKPTNGTWWTQSGSRRKLPDETAVIAAVRYVKNQTHSLVTWIARDLASGGLALRFDVLRFDIITPEG